MKKITKALWLLAAFCISSQARAHQPDLSSIILAEQGEDQWVLQVRSALTAFEYVIEKHYGPSAYTTPEEFQELVVNYMRDHISIIFNDTHPAILYKGMVKLGHETNVIFQLAGTLETIHSLVVENNSFKSISRNKSVLIVYKEGFSKDQFTLNDDNGHSIRLKIGDSKFEAVEQADGWPSLYFLIITIVILAILIILIAFKKKQALRFDSSLPW